MAFFALSWATLLGVAVYAQSMGCVFIHCYFSRGSISMAKSTLHSCAVNLMIEFYIAKFGLHHDVITSTGYGGKYKQQESNFKFLHRVLLLKLNLFYKYTLQKY
jgi:hypothetical protein